MNIPAKCIEKVIDKLTEIYKEAFFMEYIINFTWDSEANVWVATSDDVPGLVLESGSFDALLERTRITVPELLSLNSCENHPISLIFTSERHEKMVL